jgi:hypothetical protein
MSGANAIIGLLFFPAMNFDGRVPPIQYRHPQMLQAFNAEHQPRTLTLAELFALAISQALDASDITVSRTAMGGGPRTWMFTLFLPSMPMSNVSRALQLAGWCWVLGRGSSGM